MRCQRTWLQTGLLILLLASIFGPLPAISYAGVEDMAPIRFAVIGDRADGHQPDVYEQIVAEISRLDPDFIVTVGDMIEGDVDDSAQIEDEWQDYRYIISPLVSPIHFTPGDHEFWSPAAEKAYKENVGRTYYSFNFDRVHLVVLDNSRWESSNEIPSEELDWLARDLKTFKSAYYTIVFMHKPFWWQTIVYNQPDTLHALFKQYGVDAVFSGHFHQYFSETYDNIKYTCVGSSGGDIDDDFGKLGFLYVWVTVDHRGIHIAPIKLGSVLAWEEMSIGDRKVYEALRREGIKFEKPIPLAEDLTLASSSVTFTVNNTMGNYPVRDTLRWDKSAKWHISPRTVEVSVPAHESRTFTINLNCKDVPYPPPTAEVTFAYAKGKTLTARQTLPIVRSASCLPASSPPLIDGVLQEDLWKDPQARFFDPSGKLTETEPVQVFFAHDNEHLYIAAVCHESETTAIRADATTHDGPVSTDDYVGFYLEPSGSDNQAYQIFFNANGVAFDQKLGRDADGSMTGDRAWDGIYDVKTSRTADSWVMEACIPLTQFGATMNAGDQWRVNIRRKQARLGKSADWQVPIDADPRTYGVLVIK